MLIGSEFLHCLTLYRTAWYRGRYGSGKTCLAVASAKWLLDANYVDEVWSNIPVSFASGPSVLRGRRVAIVFDESHVELDNRTFAKNDVQGWGAYLRKYGVYLLLPSVWPVDVRFRALTVERLFDFTGFGVPLWLYRYEQDLGYAQDHGLFWVANPSKYFSLYDHLYDPHDSAGILDVLRQCQEKSRLDKRGNPNGDIELYHMGDSRSGPEMGSGGAAAFIAGGDEVLAQDVYKVRPKEGRHGGG